MVRAHQEPDGFSARHLSREHFTTSVQIGDHIARVVLQRCEAAARRHSIRRPWIVDVGAGDGRLLSQLLDLGFPADRLIGVDVRVAPPSLPVRWVRGVAPDCVPRVAGLLFAHEFLDDVPADRVVGGRVEVVDDRGRTRPGPAAPQEHLEWLRRWRGGETGVVGLTRDRAWRDLVARVEVGEAIAVDFTGDEMVARHRGRRVPPVPDGQRDVCAGVDLRSCRAAAGGRIVPQHRVLAGITASSITERAELAVLRERDGLGGFGWLITDVASVGSPA